jgi:hypothetical protein
MKLLDKKRSNISKNMEFSWIDLSKEDGSKIISSIDLAREPGAVDELGIGVVRDYFANKFFPGTTTIQTKAKYFLLCLYIFKYLEDSPYDKIKNYREKLNQIEKNIGINLWENNKNVTGIIGERVLPKNWVERKPSTIYWSGLREYGIFHNDKMTLNEYIRNMEKIKEDEWKLRKQGKNKKDNSENEEIDNIYAISNGVYFWEEPPKASYNKIDFENIKNNKISIKLNKEEAEFLRNKILESQKDSLLAYCLKDENIETFSKLKEQGNNNLFELLVEYINIGKIKIPDEELKNQCIIAKNVAHFLYCAEIQYNIAITKGQNDEINKIWQEYSKDGLKKIAEKVDLDDIRKATSGRKNTYEFIKNLKESMINNEEEEIRAWVEKREKELKGSRSKIAKGAEEERQWYGLGKLDYRINRGIEMAQEIKEGLEENA